MKSMDNKFIIEIESTLCDLLPSEKELIPSVVRKCVESTNTWLKELPAPTSQLNVRIFFIQELSEQMTIHEILQNEKLLSVLLDDVGLQKVGDSIELNGEKWKVIWRKMGKNFGIEFGLSNASGKVISHEFND